MDGIPALAMERSAAWPLDIIRRLALRVHTLLEFRGLCKRVLGLRDSEQ